MSWHLGRQTVARRSCSSTSQPVGSGHNRFACNRFSWLPAWNGSESCLVTASPDDCTFHETAVATKLLCCTILTVHQVPFELSIFCVQQFLLNTGLSLDFSKMLRIKCAWAALVLVQWLCFSACDHQGFFPFCGFTDGSWQESMFGWKSEKLSCVLVFVPT